MNLIKTNDFKDILEISRKNPNSIALVLFGLYAKGNNNENSDIDLGIIRKKDTMRYMILIN